MISTVVIERWLKGNKNFIIGKHLYDTYGADAALKLLFSKGETPFARQKLIAALEVLLQQPKLQQKAAPVASTIATLLPMPKGTDEVLVSIEKEWQPKYQRMNLLRHKLDEYGDDNSTDTIRACKEICKEILQLEKECEGIWQKRNHYEEHGQLPEVKEEEFVIPKDPLELSALISRLKRYIRRHKKNATDNPGNALYPALAKKYQTQLTQILNSKK